MSLYQLQELASRQQKQIESTHRLILNKEQRLNYLASMQDSQQGPLHEYDQNLNHFKEKISLQEARLQKLRLLKGQMQKQRCTNSNMCSEVENIKMLFKEKERELTVALTKIDVLTRQLDELKQGNTINSYNINGFKYASPELDKLRQELLYKEKLCQQNEEKLLYKRNFLYKRQAEMMKVDQKVTDLKSRLARKRQLNQQLTTSSQVQHLTRDNRGDTDELFATKTFLRSSMGHPATYKVPYNKPSLNSITNIATVEPLQRLKGAMYDFPQGIDQYGVLQSQNQDPKYQTLPFNTKFGGGRNMNAKQLEDTSKMVSRNFSGMSAGDCDSHRLEGASASDISLIINHKRSDSKNTSLEERPSPSGSSGSSDRISSSMTAYSYSEKEGGLNGHSPENRFFANLDKAYRRVEENGPYSPKYVPNMSTSQLKAEKGGCADGQPEGCSKSSAAPDSFYKAKPSAPVKPMANATAEEEEEEGDVVDNCRFDSSFIFTQNENSTLSTPSSGVFSSSDIFSQHESPMEKNDSQMDIDDDFNDVENVRNQRLEERSSVSEIISRINKWSVSNGGSQDWEKTKRRPVVSANEMENELTQDFNVRIPTTAISGSGSPGKETKQTGDGKENKSPKNSPDRINEKIAQDMMNNNKSKLTGSTEENTDRKEASKPKRLKGSLKSYDSNRSMKMPLGRRVSFDPLALLLDASLEGELELVKKTAHQVPNPSASNDEGISALHNSVCASHFEIVKYLVKIGCDVNVQDSDGWTPLHCAASCNNLVMIKFLVKSGACIFATTFSDQETAAEKCEEDEEGFDSCSQYLYGIQDQLGSVNSGMVYALYDYESQNGDELNFCEGDVIQVLQKGDEQEKEWWWSKMDDQEGYVPRNLIGLYPRIKPSY